MGDSAGTTKKRDIDDVIRRVERGALQVPFTASTVAMVVLAGWLTSTYAGVRLSAHAITRLGSSPADTASFNVLRGVMSAFVTNGPAAFWLAVVAIAVFAGISELRFGSLRTGLAFWGSHIVTLALSWILLGSLDLAGDAAARLLYIAHDVGPSAGYVGCLGYLLASLGSKARSTALAVGVVVLSGMLAINLGSLESDPSGVSAALSHLIALPVGFMLGVFIPGSPAAPVLEEDALSRRRSETGRHRAGRGRRSDRELAERETPSSSWHA